MKPLWGDTASLDLQNSKKAIEAKQKQVEELMANADGQEVKANVSGKISAINVTAGNNAGADTALATITVADRGYTLSIPVTADQAKQVTIGDMATITNYYSTISPPPWRRRQRPPEPRPEDAHVPPHRRGRGSRRQSDPLHRPAQRQL